MFIDAHVQQIWTDFQIKSRAFGEVAGILVMAAIQVSRYLLEFAHARARWGTFI